MNYFYPAILALTALVTSPVLAQTAAPPPQLTLPGGASGNPAPVAPAPVLTTAPANPAPVVTPPASTVKVPEDPATAFTAAVQAYEKGNYPTARELFAGAEKKATSPALEFNLGNACYQAADYGAAILHYLRALSLNPRDPDTRQNLALARKGANLTVPDETRLESYASYFNQNGWVWIASIAGWAALYLAFLPRLFRWRGLLPWALFIVALATAVAGGIGFWSAQQHARDGVALHADTQVNLSPTTNSEAVAMMQPGEIAQTLEQHGNYFKVRTATGQLGWVDMANFSPVWN